MKRMKFPIKIGLLLVSILITVSVAHAFVFPQETNCILVDFYGLEKDGNLYYREGIDTETKQKLQEYIQQAEVRVGEFWGEKTANPKFIYCETNEDYIKFGTPAMTPASAHMKLGTYVIISNKGIDLDIISHEISHTELFERIGFFNRLLEIPVWFDEGLAMQVDYRSYYSIEDLKLKTNGFKNLPDVAKMTDAGSFWEGSREEVMLNYSTAKYEVYKWYTPEKLESFIQKINDGKSFEEAYR